MADEPAFLAEIQAAPADPTAGHKSDAGGGKIPHRRGISRSESL
jgi:hypothetical protein